MSYFIKNTITLLLLILVSNQAFSVPKEFASLESNENIVVDIKYQGHIISSQIVNISINTFRFIEPEALIKDIEPFIKNDIDSIREKVIIENKLLAKRYCLKYPKECDPESNSLIFIYDPQNHIMDMHIKKDLQTISKQYVYHEPNKYQEKALLNSSAISIRSNFDGEEDFSLRTSSTLGIHDDTHLFLSSNINHSTESNKSNIESVYMRHALSNRLYFKLGKLSPYSQSEVSEGLFNYNLLPKKEIRGFQFGTGMHYFNTDLKNDERKIEIFSIGGGRADIYQNEIFISSVNLYPGYTKIDTHKFLGKFNGEINIHIYENGQLTRVDTHSLFSKSRLSDGLPQWIIKAGLNENGDDILEFATWYQTNKHINWLNDISFSSQNSNDGFFNEFGASTSKSYISSRGVSLDWSNSLRLMLGKHSGDDINRINLESSLSTGKVNLNIGYKRYDSELCLRDDISSCLEEYRLSVGTSVYSNSLRLSHEIRNKHIDTPYTSYKRELSTLSLSRSLPIEKVSATISSSISQTHINNKFRENNFYINLALSLKDTPSLYSIDSHYSDEGVGLGTSYNYNGLNKELYLRAESNKGQDPKFLGSSSVEMFDKGKLTTSFALSESNSSAFLGYSLGLALTEKGVLSTGPASFSNNLSAIMLTTDSEKLPTHQIKTNAQVKDVRPSFNKLSYPLQGYNYTSYIINESREFDDGKSDTIQRGTGRRDMLLTPGHLFAHEISYRSEQYYLGQNHKLSGKVISSEFNNLSSLDIDDNGNYFIIANSYIDGFNVYINNEPYFCKFSHIDTSNDINRVDMTSCNKI